MNRCECNYVCMNNIIFSKNAVVVNRLIRNVQLQAVWCKYIVGEKLKAAPFSVQYLPILRKQSPVRLATNVTWIAVKLIRGDTTITMLRFALFLDTGSSSNTHGRTP